MPFKGPQLRLVRCLWNYKDTRTPSGPGVSHYLARMSQGAPSTTTDVNLDSVFVENALVLVVPDYTHDVFMLD